MAQDMNIDVNEASKWNAEVAEELREVREILNKVSQSCTNPGMQDDAIIAMLKAGGDELNEKWTKLCNTFDDVVESTNASIDLIKKAIEKSVEYVKNMNK